MTTLLDALGTELRVGDTVAFASYKNCDRLTVGWVTKLGRRRVEVACDHSSPSDIAPWLHDGWSESKPSQEIIRINN